MSPVAVALILTAAFAHAGWNLVAKRAESGGAIFVWLYAALSLVLLLPAAALVMVFSQRPAWTWLVALSVSGALHVAYFLLLQRGYADGDLSVVHPLARGTGPVLSVAFAVVLLGERPGTIALLGAGAVVCGVFVIGTARSAPGARSAPRGRIAIGYGLLTGVAIAGYTLWDANAVTTLAVPPVVQMAGAGTVEMLLLTPYALARRDRLGELWRANRREAGLVAVLSPLAYVLVLYALRIAPVALVAPARELSIVIAGVAAWRMFGEPHPARRLTGAVIVLAGVAALAVG